MKPKVAIIGGGIMGSSIAWWLTRDPSFSGSVTVIEADPSFANASSTHTNSCIRQQFGSEINIRLSQFTAEFIRAPQTQFGNGAPDIRLQNFGYLYLAETPHQERIMRENFAVQQRCGAGTRLQTADEIAARFPFYALDDIRLCSHNTLNEGYFDGSTLFDLFRRSSRDQGAKMITDRASGLELRSGRVTGVELVSGDTLRCDIAINAAGPRAAEVAAMAGLALPVEPRKRFTFVFEAADPLPCDLPLTIDPSGVHVRTDGGMYMAGCAPDDDVAVDPDDFAMDHGIWQDKVWPAVATRIPTFERIKLRHEWAGHYAYNTLDQNAILGPHPDVEGLLFACGFSGHGLQQAAGIGRGIAEWVRHEEWRTLDLTPLSMQRILENRPLPERNVI